MWKLLRRFGRLIARSRIESDLYSRHYYWEGEIPFTSVEIDTMARRAEEFEFHAAFSAGPAHWLRSCPSRRCAALGTVGRPAEQQSAPPCCRPSP